MCFGWMGKALWNEQILLPQFRRPFLVPIIRHRAFFREKGQMAFLHEKWGRLPSRIWMGSKVFGERFAKTTQRMSTFHLFFNERTQAFTIIPTGVTITEHHDGHEIYRSENVDELRGIAKGLIFARFCSHPLYTLEGVSRAVQTSAIVKEKID